MRIASSVVSNVIGLAISLIVLFLISQILIIPAKYAIAVVLAALAFLLYKYIISDKTNYDLEFTLPRVSKVILIPVLLGISTLSIVLVPEISHTMFIEWNSLSPFNLLSLLSGVFLTSFLPGYLILSIFDKNNRLDKAEQVLFSVIISLFIIPFLGCLAFGLGSSVNQVGLVLVLGLNWILLLPFLFSVRRLKQKPDMQKIPKRQVDLYGVLILLCMLVLQIVLIYVSLNGNIIGPYGDSYDHYGFSILFSQNSFPISKIGAGISYPYWFHLQLATVYTVSGVPSANAFQLMNFVVELLPIFSFYLMVRAFFGHTKYNKIPAIATALISLGAFGWLYKFPVIWGAHDFNSIYSVFFSLPGQTNSGYLASPPNLPENSPLYGYAMTTIFTLIWLIYSNRGYLLKNLRYFLLAIVIAYGLLGHLPEIPIFVLVFCASLFLLKKKSLDQFRNVSFSLVAGLSVCILPDLFTSSTYYLLGYHYLIVTIALLVVAGFLLFVRAYMFRENSSVLWKLPKRDFSRLQRINVQKYIDGRYLKLGVALFVIYFYGLSFIIWNNVLLSFGGLPIENHSVPWYMHPMRFGIVGVFALAAFIYLLFKKNERREFRLFFFFAITFLLIGRAMTFYSIYWEDRMLLWLTIPLSILGAFMLGRFSEKLRSVYLKPIFRAGSRILVGLMVAAIIFLSFSPFLLTVEASSLNVWTSGLSLSNDELQGLNYLRLNVKPTESVLTIAPSDPPGRWTFMLKIAGLSGAQTFVNNYQELHYSTFCPETTIYLLSKSQVGYIYLTTSSFAELKTNPIYNGFLANGLFDYLPVVFKNADSTIYKVPQLSSPRESDFGIVVPEYSVGWKDDSFIDGWNGTFCMEQSNGTTLLIPPKDGGQLNAIHKINTDISVNQTPYVTIRWFGDGLPLYLGLTADSGSNHTISLGTSSGWIINVINLRSFVDYYNDSRYGFDRNDVISSVSIVALDNTTSYSIDYIKFYGLSVSTPDLGVYYDFPLFMAALSNVQYSIVSQNDPGRFFFKTLMLSSDPQVTDKTQDETFQSYLHWVAAGGNLVVLESQDVSPYFQTKFADLLSLKKVATVNANGIGWQQNVTLPTKISVPKVTSDDGTVQVISNYTLNGNAVSPFALRKQYGNGSITYVEMSPYFAALKNSSIYLKKQWFGGLSSVMDSLQLNLQKVYFNSTPYIPVFDYAKAPLLLEGKIKVQTNFLNLESKDLQIDHLDLSFTQVLTNSKDEVSNLSKVVLLGLEFSDVVNSSIDCASAQFVPNSLGSYLSVELGNNFNWTMQLPRDGKLALALNKDGEILDITVQGGEVIFQGVRDNAVNRTLFTLKNPLLSGEGFAYFERARLFIQPYSFPLFYQDGPTPWILTGEISFQALLSDSGMLVLTNTKLNGSGQHVLPPFSNTEFNEFSIPWQDVFSSKFNIALTVSIIFAIIAMFVNKRYEIRVIRRQV
jgi:hypothetical protein